MQNLISQARAEAGFEDRIYLDDMQSYTKTFPFNDEWLFY